ncbi:MAG TPA: DUF6084 family protein [Polyangiaceae bacterium]|nr:DUF6084 family protein [Polyangiaceae bacterium]
MTELAFRLTGARAVEHAATPSLALGVGVSAGAGVLVDAVLLRSAVRIEVARRPYDPGERERLREVFGSDGAWARSPKSLLWAQATSVVPGFEGETAVDVIVPCGFDFAAQATRYLHALAEGDVPVTVQFSGTVFHRTESGLRAAPIPWDREAPFRVPVALLRQIVDDHFPGAAVVGVERDIFYRLDDYRRDRGLRTFGEAIDRLLHAAREGGP